MESSVLCFFCHRFGSGFGRFLSLSSGHETSKFVGRRGGDAFRLLAGCYDPRQSLGAQLSVARVH